MQGLHGLVCMLFYQNVIQHVISAEQLKICNFLQLRIQKNGKIFEVLYLTDKLDSPSSGD